MRLAIIGAGAAGLMAAIWAGRTSPPGTSVLLLDGAKEPGRKILISGGGRCNVLPARSEPADFHTQGSRNVLRRLLDSWKREEQQRFFEEDLRLPLVLEADSDKLFPASQRARTVLDRLLEAARAARVELHCPWRVAALTKDGAEFVLRSEDGQELRADRLILASGGKSVPKTGSDGLGYSFAQSLGHSLLPTYPALVPLSTHDARLTALAGISLPVRWSARVGGKVMEERAREMLFTHHGFSGPAMLDASHWFTRDQAEIRIAWGALGREEWSRILVGGAAGRRSVGAALSEHMPARLAEALCVIAEVPAGTQVAQLDRPRRERLLAALSDFPLPISGDRGFAVAEVTGGGVPLSEVDPRTLESRACPGLFLCGEILDVIGRIGGFNFQWAWATGRLAGESAADG